MAIKKAAETKTRGEERRLNRVKASPEDARPSRTLRLQVSYRCAREKLARKDANTLRMDSSATVKMRLRKGAAALRSRRPLAAFRERILCCGRKINNGRAEPFVEQNGERRSSFSSLLCPPLAAAAVAAADFPRSADASLAFSVCSTNKPSSSKKPAIPHRNVAVCSRVPSFSFLLVWSPRSLFLSFPIFLSLAPWSSIEAPFDRFLETKTSRSRRRCLSLLSRRSLILLP